LRGACQACGARIDASHLIGEIVGGVILLSALAAASPPRAGLLAALGLTLLASSVHDLKTQRLPDSFTAVVAGCAAALAWLQSEQTFWLGLVCACTAFVALEAMRRSFIWLRRKPGLGFGDVKLVTALALWLGLATPWAVALASLMGLAAALRQPAERRLAFGPWIAVAAWCVGLAGEARLWPSLT
jgi:leader peptidase (prepilin peptidase)/N-methyltransferase